MSKSLYDWGLVSSFWYSLPYKIKKQYEEDYWFIINNGTKGNLYNLYIEVLRTKMNPVERELYLKE